MPSDKTEIFLSKIRKRMNIEDNDDQDLNIAFLHQALLYAEDIFRGDKWIFDTYTDHKDVHVRNVVRLMYQLLSEMQIFDQLNSLELALCLLAAYYHDTGMFLSQEDEKRCLAQIRQRQAHRRKRDGVPRNEETEADETDKSLQNFVRQNHGKFVSNKLRQVREHSNGEVQWIWMENGNRRDIEEELAVICESHYELTENLAELLEKRQMGPNVRNVNYMLCCVVLRIADLLDFDQTRTSPLRYYSAGLTASQLTKDEKLSRDEMQKHMQSCGFSIKYQNNTLVFRLSAQPQDPYFENKIRTYAGNARKDITQDLEQLKIYTWKFTRSFPDRKEDFDIDYSVEMNTESISRKGYESGDYQFQISKKEILQYFTGEELYNDRTVFFRELFQNAIDTCLFVASIGGYGEKEKPNIEIAYWTEKGSRWLQITDNGAGMDQKIIQNYFLTVGASFYNSKLFSDKFSNISKRNSFTAISRFGIGILSCFMVSNHVEIVTRSRGLTGKDKSLYYLQMLNTNEQYILRKDSHIISFPRKKELDLFCGGYGTSVVLKLNPDIGFSDETIRERLQDFVFLPGVNIEYLCAGRREPIWEAKTVVPFGEGYHPYQLSHAETENVIRCYNGSYTMETLYLSPLHIFLEVLALDIGKHCADSNINGYLYVALIYDKTMLDKKQDLNEYSGFTIHCNNNAVILIKNQQVLANATLPDIGFPGIDFNQVKVYFNGVLHAAVANQEKNYYSVCGNLSLSGAHRPNVPVSRDGNAIFSLNTLSLLSHAFRSAVRSQAKQNQQFGHIYDGVRLPPMLCHLNEMPTYGAVLKAEGMEELWMKEQIIHTEVGVMSIGEIQKYVSDYGELRLINTFKSKYILSVIGAYLVQKYLKIKARFRNRQTEIIVFGTKEVEDQIEAIQEFPCLFFMEYEGTDHLRVGNTPYNINHPLSRIVIQLAEDVKISDDDRRSSYLQLLLNCLKVKYTRPDMLNQNLIVPINQVLKEMGISMTITDRDFIIGPKYEFDLAEELSLI